jgi:hypothetical protein
VIRLLGHATHASDTPGIVFCASAYCEKAASFLIGCRENRGKPRDGKTEGRHNEKAASFLIGWGKTEGRR